MNDRTLAVILALALSSATVVAAPAPAPSPVATSATTAAAPDAAPDASATALPEPPTPRHKPDPKDEAYSTKPPIVVAGSSPAAAMTTASTTAKAFPKPKPAMAAAAGGPFPRSKPGETTVATAVAPSAPSAPAAAPAPAAPAMTTAPAAPVPTAASAASGCGDACNEVIFRSIGNCLYVQNANPHAVTFVAQAGGHTITLALAGADAAKADAHKPFESKEGTPSAVGEGAYHTRISDPFSPNSPGIAVYRARLGTSEACVKSRGEVTSYSASFVKGPAK